MSTPLAYKDLKAARRRATGSSWRARNKDKVREKNRRWREKNKDYASKAAKSYRAANPDVDKRKRYDLAQADWDALFEKQGKACATCKTKNPGRQPWHTDHDHVTGRVRGILCFRCNIALGMLGDDYESVTRMLANLVSYLNPMKSD